MKLLSVDTSSAACSVALLADGQIHERYAEQDREHTRLLVPMISELLALAEVRIADVDALVLGNGPGSFIGMRISASLVQGLAFAAQRPVVSVSSLLAVAEAVFASHACDEVIVAQDAHMNEVYLGRFRRDSDGHVQSIVNESLHEQGRIDGLEGDVVRLAAGAGWARYPDLYAANEHQISGMADQLYPVASRLLPAAIRAVERGELSDPADIEPCYLRHEVAVRPAQP